MRRGKMRRWKMRRIKMMRWKMRRGKMRMWKMRRIKMRMWKLRKLPKTTGTISVLSTAQMRSERKCWHMKGSKTRTNL